MKRAKNLRTTLAGMLIAVAAPLTAAAGGVDLSRIEHVVIIYQENWSFDGLYGQFPGADGYPFGKEIRQVTPTGDVLSTMENPKDDEGHFFESSTLPKPLGVRFTDLRDFDGGPSGGYDHASETADVVHRFYPCIFQIHDGANDRYLAFSYADGKQVAGAPGNMNSVTLTGVDASTLPEGVLAQEYVLCDRCFQSAHGGSFLNHQYLIAARPSVFANATTALLPNGKPVSTRFPKTKPDGTLDTSGPIATWDTEFAASLVPGSTTDAYVVNTIQPAYPPTRTGSLQLPPLHDATIGDRMSAGGVSWRWYAEGWDMVTKAPGAPDAPSKEQLGRLGFQFHHQPFNYYAAFDPGTEAGRANRAEHLVDLDALRRDLASHRLPNVSFVKFSAQFNEHPGYASLLDGQQKVAELVRDLQHSDAWPRMAIFITYDENGGRWDHVAPPKGDAFGPGPRVPMIVISPLAKRHFVDHTTYETVSLLRFIEDRWHLESLTDRDRNAASLVNAFEGGTAASHEAASSNGRARRPGRHR